MDVRKSFPSLVLSAALALGATGCSEPSRTDPRTAAPRVSIAVVQADGVSSQAYTGVITARVQGDLGFRVAGKVVERMVDTGQAVKRGQPLMRLDPADLALAFDAQAAAVGAARARALQAGADEARLRGLVEQGAISAQTYDQARAAADSARALLDAAEAQQQAARNAAGYALLVADADGVVVDVLAEPGQVVRAGEPVVRVAHAGRREALVNLPEAVRPAPGSSARATLHGRPDATFNARLRQLSEAADPRSRTYEARYVLDGEAASAPIGATVTLRIADASSGGRVRVPIAALHDAGKGPGVWLLDAAGASVSFRPVKVAHLGAEMVSIASGVVEGDRVVAMGAHLLHDGQAVRSDGLPGVRP